VSAVRAPANGVALTGWITQHHGGLDRHGRHGRHPTRALISSTFSSLVGNLIHDQYGASIRSALRFT
jgi:hypothetical protein